MNKAFYIIAIPAFIVSFCWLYFGWGWKFALATIILELAAAIWGVAYLRKKETREAANQRATAGEGAQSASEEQGQSAQQEAGTHAR